MRSDDAQPNAGIEDSIATPNNGAIIIEGAKRETEAWTESLIVRVDESGRKSGGGGRDVIGRQSRLREQRTQIWNGRRVRVNDLPKGRVEIRKLSILFRRKRLQLVAQAQIQGEVGRRFVVILYEPRVIRLDEVVCGATRHQDARCGITCEKIGEGVCRCRARNLSGVGEGAILVCIRWLEELHMENVAAYPSALDTSV